MPIKSNDGESLCDFGDIGEAVVPKLDDEPDTASEASTVSEVEYADILGHR